jgi:hypothetical protein
VRRPGRGQGQQIKGCWSPGDRAERGALLIDGSGKRGTWCVQVVADRPASAGPEFLLVQSISFERPKQKRAFTLTNN